MEVISLIKKQKIIISYLRKYNKILKNNYEDVFYFNTWANNSGNFFIKNNFINLSFLDYLFISFRLLYKKIRDENSIFFSKQNLKSNDISKIKNIIISYQTLNNKHFDNHFGCERSKAKNSLWFLINLNEKSFNTNYNSIIIIKKETLNKIFAFFLSIILFPIWIFKKKKSIYQKNFFEILKENLNQIPLQNIKKVFLPYESQPFQKLIINELKKKNKQLKIIGYAHGGLPSFPVEYHKNINLDKFFVHSRIEKKILLEIFGWRKNQVEVDRAFRFFKKQKIKKNFIYFPYDFDLNQNLYSDLKYLCKKYKLDNFSIANHPAMKMSKKHLILVKKLNEFKHLKSTKKKILLKNTSLFIGVTGSILEGLQNRLNIIHITNFPELELYSKYLWKSFSTKKISNRVFLYKRGRDELIRYSKVNYFIKKFNL